MTQNLGLLDQRLAVQWVHDNIAALGEILHASLSSVNLLAEQQWIVRALVFFDRNLDALQPCDLRDPTPVFARLAQTRLRVCPPLPYLRISSRRNRQLLTRALKRHPLRLAKNPKSATIIYGRANTSIALPDYSLTTNYCSMLHGHYPC